MIETLLKAALAAKLADEKKGEDIKVLELQGLCNFTDAFVICTGKNRLHLKAIADSITDGLKQMGVTRPLQDGYRNANWTVLDYGDIIVHIMSEESREFYRLEHLWGDAVAVDWEKVISENPVAAGSEL